MKWRADAPGFPDTAHARGFRAWSADRELGLEARDAIVSAEFVVIIFPLWHGTLPALLKVFV